MSYWKRYSPRMKKMPSPKCNLCGGDTNRLGWLWKCIRCGHGVVKARLPDYEIALWKQIERKIEQADQLLDAAWNGIEDDNGIKNVYSGPNVKAVQKAMRRIDQCLEALSKLKKARSRKLSSTVLKDSMVGLLKLGEVASSDEE